MEKIGICTFYNNNNYGSYLQTFALEAVIGSMGYNAYLIDFNDYTKPWNRQLRNKTIFSRIKCILFHPQLLVEALKAAIKCGRSHYQDCIQCFFFVSVPLQSVFHTQRV